MTYKHKDVSTHEDRHGADIFLSLLKPYSFLMFGGLEELLVFGALEELLVFGGLEELLVSVGSSY